GGFQHAIIEFARNVLGVQDADHAETNPDAERLVITPLACSLVGQQQAITIVPGSRAAKLYDTNSAVEDFYCNYGVNPAYQSALEAHGLSVSGMGRDGEIRIVELRDHPFFMATLFLPQARSSRATPHPVLLGYAAALSSKPK